MMSPILGALLLGAQPAPQPGAPPRSHVLRPYLLALTVAKAGS